MPEEGKTKQGHLYVSVNESMAFWVKANHGPPAPVQRQDDRRKGHRKTRGAQAKGDKEVVLYSLEGWNHSLPTRRHTHALRETDPLRDFDATEILWAFFKRHRR